MLSIQQDNVIDMADLVVGRVQPGRALDTQSSTVEATISAGTQRAQQSGIEATAEHARRPGGLALDAAGMDERVTADTEVDAAWNGTGRAVDDRRATELKTSTTDVRRRHRNVLFHSTKHIQQIR